MTTFYVLQTWEPGSDADANGLYLGRTADQAVARFLEECGELLGEDFADLGAAADALEIAYELSELEV